MRYLSVAEIAKKWDVSERSVRNYCAQGRVNGAFLTGKTWNIPENAEKPERTNKRKEGPITLLDILKEQKASKYSGGIYHKTQIDLTYNSNHMEGSRLTHDQTRYIFETNTIGVEKEVLNVDDVIETANHFRCIDMIIDHAKAALTEKLIKELHLVLKNGTSDSRKDWFAVAEKMKALLTEYELKNRYMHVDYVDDNSQSVTPKAPKSQFDTLECTLEELAFLELIYKNPSIKQKDLVAETGKSLSTVKRIMESLQKKEYIRRVDGKRYGKWEILI